MKNENQYGLHDTEINGISVCKKCINLDFNKGVYILNEYGKEVSLTGSCVMSIGFCDFGDFNYTQHIEVNIIYKNKIKEVQIEEFIKLLNKNPFEIYMDYYSLFSRALLLKGYIGKKKIELIISEIEEIDYVFNNDI